jgi:hypothetical protein
MINIKLYTDQHKSAWNWFVKRSKNGIFFFQREYMEYHSDRFIDNSLLFYKGNKLVALLPANKNQSILHSYGGLTFGGIISDNKMKMTLMLDVFESLKIYMLKNGFNTLIYKTIPNIYHSYPSGEDLYALFYNGAKLIRRDVSSTIDLKERLNYGKGRKWSLKKGKSNKFEIVNTTDFNSIMAIEEELLISKYGVRPVHTHEELSLLQSRFPDNIKLFAIYEQKQMIAGVVVYESNHVAHTQYISATEKGKKEGALDCILDYLITSYSVNKKYFDFGISTENEGTYLNRALIQNKESYGARSLVHDFYELTVDNHLS